MASGSQNMTTYKAKQLVNTYGGEYTPVWVDNGILKAITAGTTGQFYRGDKTWSNTWVGTTPDIRLKSNTTTSYAILRLHQNNADSGGIIFLNGSGRTDDGGANTMTIRNDIGSLRLNNNNVLIGANGIDNTAFRSSIILFANQTNESSQEAFTTANSSWGITFRRQWNTGTQNNSSAGIYAVGSGNWRTGLVFRVKNNTTGPDGNHDISAMWISPAGRVGIGTVSPTALLHVHRDNSTVTTQQDPGIRIDGKLDIYDNVTGGGTANSILNIIYNGSHEYGVPVKIHSYGGDSPGIRFSHSSSAADLNSQVNTNWTVGMYHTSTEDFAITKNRGTSGWGTAVLYINSSENVGIGTTSPSYKLSINGDCSATNFIGTFVGGLSGNAATASAITGNTIIDTHGEGTNTRILDGGNFLYAFYDRGGTCTAYEVASSVTDFTGSLTKRGNLSQIPANVFNGSLGYEGGSYSGDHWAVYDLKVPAGASYKQYFYWSFGNGSWKPGKMRILASNNGTSYTQFYSSDSCPAYGQCGIGFGGTATYYIRIVVSKYSRLCCFGWTHYGYPGLRTTYMNRCINDAIYRSISPAIDNKYDLGGSSNRWKEIRAVNFYGYFNGDISGSSATCRGNAASATTAAACSGHAAADLKQWFAGTANKNAVIVTHTSTGSDSGRGQCFAFGNGNGTPWFTEIQYGSTYVHTIRLSNGMGATSFISATQFAIISTSWDGVTVCQSASSGGPISSVATAGDNYSANGTNYRAWIEGNSVTSAVWNDYAENRETINAIPGQCVYELGDDTLAPTEERLSHFAGIVSDTWGFSQGETEVAKSPIAVAGRVLAYTYRCRDEYKPGDVLCAAPGGTVDIMTREEVQMYPDRIVGTVSCVPEYETWGGGENADREPVEVDGRIWVKVH